ncbi:MAG: hypothetical protein QXT28_09095 [Thermofilaceae archaeon]
MKVPVILARDEDYLFLKMLKHARESGTPLVLWLRKDGTARLVLPQERWGSWLVWRDGGQPRFVLMRSFYTFPNGVRLVVAYENLASSVNLEQVSGLQRIVQDSAELVKNAVAYYSQQAQQALQLLEKLPKDSPDAVVKARYVDYCRSMISHLSNPETRARALLQYLQDSGAALYDGVDPSVLHQIAPAEADILALEAYYRYYFSAKLHEMQALLKVGRRSLKPLVMIGLIFFLILLVLPLAIQALHALGVVR